MSFGSGGGGIHETRRVVGGGAGGGRRGRRVGGGNWAATSSSSGGSGTRRGGRGGGARHELFGSSTSRGGYTVSTSGLSPVGEATSRAHADFLAVELRKQEQMVREQDSSLEMLSGNLTKLGDMSYAVSRELDEQTIMLDELDMEVEKAEDGLAKVNAQAAELVRKSGGPKWFCVIVWLVLVILFLLFLLVYT